MQVCRDKWKTQPVRQSSTPPRTSPLRVAAVSGPPGSSLLRLVLPGSSGARPAPPLLPSGRPVPPFKPPGLFARTSGLLAAAAVATVQLVSNGDDVSELDEDDDDEFDDDDDDDEEDWDDDDDDDDDEYDLEQGEDAPDTAAAAGQLQATVVSYCRKSSECITNGELSDSVYD